MTLPLGTGLSSTVGCAIQPTWELMSLYDHPAIIDEDGNPVRFDSMSDFWNTSEKEPRARATFFFSGMTEPLSGVVLDQLAGVYKSYLGSAADGTFEEVRSVNDYTDLYSIRAQEPSTVMNEVEGGYTNVKTNGSFGMADGKGDEGYGYTGAFIRKYVSPSDASGRQELMYCKTPFKVVRYGEILCNWAEAAYELGEMTGNATLMQEAIDHVNELRNRASAIPYVYNPAPEDVGTDIYGFKIDENLQFIRDERARELAFENHSIFDILRWRVADQMFLNGKFSHTISCYYVLDEGNYIFLNEVDGQGRKVNFDKRNDCEQMAGHEISKNPNIVRNDGY